MVTCLVSWVVFSDFVSCAVLSTVVCSFVVIRSFVVVLVVVVTEPVVVSVDIVE